MIPRGRGHPKNPKRAPPSTWAGAEGGKLEGYVQAASPTGLLFTFAQQQTLPPPRGNVLVVFHFLLFPWSTLGVKWTNDTGRRRKLE